MKANEKITDLTNKTQKYYDEHKEKIKNISFNVIQVFILLTLIVGVNILTAGFDLTILGTWSYWLRVLTTMFIIIFMFNVGINSNYDNVYNADNVLQARIVEYNEKIKLKDTNFAFYIDTIKNRQIKIDYFIDSIKNKLFKLDKKATGEDKVKFSKGDITTQYGKEKQILLKQLENEYIDKNIDYIAVKCPQIKASSFDLPIEKVKVANEYYIDGSIARGKATKMGTAIIMSICVGMIINTITISALYENIYTAIFNLLVNLFAMVYRFVQGRLFTKQLITEQITAPYIHRINILNDYITWNKDTPKSFIKELTDKISTDNEKSLETPFKAEITQDLKPIEPTISDKDKEMLDTINNTRKELGL